MHLKSIIRYCAVSLFFLFAYFSSGCEQASDNTHPINKQYKVTVIQKISSKVIKRQLILHDQFKHTADNKYRNNSLKKRITPTQPKKKEKPVPTVQPQNKTILVLSIPHDTLDITRFNKSSSNVKNNYLPDLFTDNKDKNNHSLQIAGKLIKKEEHAVDKNRVLDGARLDFNLTY